MEKNKAFLIRKTHFLKKDEYICSVCGYTADRAYKTCPSCGEQIAKTKYDAVWADEISFFDDIAGD